MNQPYSKLLNKALDSEYFSNKTTLELAKDLLGKALVLKDTTKILAGKIVETEAYLFDDEASHSFKGKTFRNSSMFLNAGHAYVYYIYGNYFCFNVVSANANLGEAVLIRALEPLIGTNEMLTNRINTSKSKNLKEFKLEQLCNGPAKLAMSFGITKKLDGHKLWQDPLFIADYDNIEAYNIISTKRVGITKNADLNYRFYIKNNSFISKT